MIISLYYFSYKPRIEVSAYVEMKLPSVGDKIHVPKKWITKMNKGKRGGLLYGLDFFVKERYVYFHNDTLDHEWRIYLELSEDAKQYLK